MPFATLSDYMGFALLWTLPLLSAAKFALMLKKVVATTSGRLIDRTEKRDKRLEEMAQKELISFHQKMGGMALEINEAWNPYYAYVGGETLGKHRAVFIVMPGLDAIDDQAFKWMYKREFYFMIHHAMIKMQSIKCLAMAAVAFFLSVIMEYSFAFAIFGTMMTGACLESLCRHTLDYLADGFASRHASLEELQGALRFLTAAARESQKLSWIQKVFHSLMHPTYFFRMRRVKKVLAKQGVLEGPTEEKVSALQALLTKNNQEELLFIEAKKQQVLRWIDADED